ncbi:MAG: hypothetical protein IPL61_39660 [Myxococcales bacterium]|nr:hypothetical protein [Myxococcales bacterium]
MPSIAVLVGSVAAVGLLGCATYSPGSFAARGESFTGQLATIGCLDLAVAGTRDAVAPGPVVDFQFGNRCDHAVHVDLSAVRATGRTSAGERVALVAYDPYGEIARQKLEARGIGRERLEYRSARDFGTDLIEVCVEVGQITEGGAPSMMCVAPEPGRVAEVTP